MNSFQSALQPFRDALLAMPLSSRLIAGMLVLTIAIGFGLLLKADAAIESEFLFGGRSLSENEVDSVEMAFSQAGLNSWTREGRRIRVPVGNRNEYLSALRQSSALPLALRSSVQEAIDKASPFESSQQRVSRELHAKAQDLGAKISAFPDVRWASVDYDRGERTGLSRSRSQSASVVVSPEGNEPLTKSRINMIKELIRGSYAGITSQDVVVIDTNASQVGGGWEDEDPMLRKRLEEEKSYEQKVMRALIGYGPIRVTAHAELDPTMGVEKTSLKYDSRRGRLDYRDPTSDNDGPDRYGPDHHGPDHHGRGSAPDAIGNRSVSLEADRTSLRSTHPDRDDPGLIGQQYESSRLAALQVKRVRISVGLPTSYYERVLVRDFLRDNPHRTAADMPRPPPELLAEKRSETEDKIKAAVTPLLPSQPVSDEAFPLVTVWDYPDLPEPTLVALGSPAQLLNWLSDSWSKLAMLGLAAAALLVARSALLGGDNDPRDRAATVRSLARDSVGSDRHQEPTQAADATAAGRNAGPRAAGDSPRGEFCRLVETHPEIAADVLRAWVREAA